MNLQKSIMLEYLSLKGNPSLRKMNHDTGIQTTRLFRLMNGAKMKIDEYQIFQAKVFELKGASQRLLTLVSECCEKLSSDSQRDIEKLLSQRLALWNLKQS